MGCRTGFYLLLAGDYTSKDIVPLMTEMYEFIRDFHGEVPQMGFREFPADERMIALAIASCTKVNPDPSFERAAAKHSALLVEDMIQHI